MFDKILASYLIISLVVTIVYSLGRDGLNFVLQYKCDAVIGSNIVLSAIGVIIFILRQIWS